MMWLRYFVILVFALYSPSLFAQEITREQALSVKFPVTDIDIVSKADKTHQTLSVELARTPLQMRVGLMYRDSLPHDSGMLFIYTAELDGAAFWMKNTYIPLDIIFIDSHGIIRHIHRHAQPHDETHIKSPYPTKSVLELPAGSAQNYNIQVGDEIFSPFLVN